MTPLEHLYEAAARDFIPSGTLDVNGRPVVRPPISRPQHLGPRLVEVDGINVHADLRVEAGDRDGRRRLIRYALRPPFAYDQLTHMRDGRIAFALRKRRRNGDTHRFFTALQFLRRLAWLIVPPRQHLVRYQGLLGPAARWRARLVSSPPKDPSPALDHGTDPSAKLASPPAPAKRRPLSWPELLRRVYDLNALTCTLRVLLRDDIRLGDLRLNVQWPKVSIKPAGKAVPHPGRPGRRPRRRGEVPTGVRWVLPRQAAGSGGRVDPGRTHSRQLDGDA